MLAITALQDERVRAHVIGAPAAARRWAEQRRADSDGSGPGLANLDPTQRFGRRGLERRLDALQRNVALVFPDPSDAAGVAIYRAIDELDRATSVSATMPLVKRRGAYSRISDGIAQLEAALVDAVLPPHS